MALHGRRLYQPAALHRALGIEPFTAAVEVPAGFGRRGVAILLDLRGQLQLSSHSCVTGEAFQRSLNPESPLGGAMIAKRFSKIERGRVS